MNTTYHIGDIFKIKGKPALAVIIDISTTQDEQYSVTYIDPITHNECDRDFGKNAWWTVEEIQKKSIPLEKTEQLLNIDESFRSIIQSRIHTLQYHDKNCQKAFRFKTTRAEKYRDSAESTDRKVGVL